MNLSLRNQILEALSHPESSDGLYLENLLYVHEDEERPQVEADQDQVLEELSNLIKDGLVKADDSGEKVIFILSSLL